MLRKEFYSPLRVAEMSFPEVEAQIRRCPSLVLPVGGLEPVGPVLPLGVVNDCIEAVANMLSARLEVLVAPVMSYGDTIPFKAFGGSAGMHRDTRINVIAECCKCWLFHGVQRIMVLSFAMDASAVLASVEKRVQAASGRKEVIRCVSLQEDEQFRSLSAEIYGGTECGRSERGFDALARYLAADHEPDRAGAGSTTAVLPDAATLRQWRRRGRDPEKLRKIAPDALFSASTPRPAAAQGRELFEKTVEVLADEYSPFLTVKDHAPR